MDHEFAEKDKLTAYEWYGHLWDLYRKNAAESFMNTAGLDLEHKYALDETEFLQHSGIQFANTG